MNKQENRQKSIYLDKENDEYEIFRDHVRDLVGKTCVAFLPKLAEKLKKKYRPEDQLDGNEIHQRNREIEDRLLEDWGNNRPWADQTIYNVITTKIIWIVNPNYAIGKSRAQQQKLTESVKKQERLTQGLEQAFKPIETPPKPKEKQTISITDDSQIARVLDEPDLGPAGKSITQTYGEIFGPALDLIEGLTGQRIIPRTDKDSKQSIKAAIERFMTVYYEIDDVQKTGVVNAFGFLIDLLSDLLERIDKK